MSCAPTRHSIPRYSITVHSAGASAGASAERKCKCMAPAEGLIWAAGVRSDVHQLALPRPDKWGFSGHCLRKYAPNFVRSQLDSGVPRRWIPHQRPKRKGTALHLQSGIWRANERRRVPELTITQAPEPVETSHSCCRGNISIIPHTHRIIPMLDGIAEDNTASAAHTMIVSTLETVDKVRTHTAPACATARPGGCPGRALGRPPQLPSQGWAQGLMLASESESRGRPLYCVCRG